MELVFPTQAIPLVIAGIPESLLPIHGCKTQLHYRCQFTDRTQVFLQKAEACTHIHHDHLNVALACLYCSCRENPKMCWFSSSAWEKHICKQIQDGHPIFPDDPAFTQLSPKTLPSTSSSTLRSLPLEIILERAKAARQCLVKESKSSSSSKHRVHQGPVKTARNREMSRSPEVSQVTIFSHPKWSLTWVTPSLLWSLPLIKLYSFLIELALFKTVTVKLNHYNCSIVRENIPYIKQQR